MESYLFKGHIHFILQMLSHLMTTYVLLIWQTYSFSLNMPITVEFVQTCVPIPNTTAHDVLSASHKYFTFVSHISSFTFIIPWVFLVWQAYLFFCKFLRICTAIHKYFVFCSHICSFTSMTAYVSLIWKYTFFLIYANKF